MVSITETGQPSIKKEPLAGSHADPRPRPCSPLLSNSTNLAAVSYSG